MTSGLYLPRPGELVAGRYRILDELGRGGFGVVFVAEQIGLNRKVAIKSLLPKVAINQSHVARFEREAQLVKDLINPHTIRIYDFGRTDQGVLFLVMEFLHGVQLKAALRSDGPFDGVRTCHVIEQVLKSLIEAHGVGIIHRDLKPENIMLLDVPGEERDFVKVLDFGIAKAVGADSDELKRLTTTGQGFGTPLYMAPEIIQSESIGPWSDLYAVGLIMIELLTGYPAIDGRTPTDILRQQISPEPVPIPSQVVASGLTDVVARATMKDASRRFRSAESFLAALRQVTGSRLLARGTEDEMAADPIILGSGRLDVKGHMAETEPLPPPGKLSKAEEAKDVEMAQPRRGPPSGAVAELVGSRGGKTPPSGFSALAGAGFERAGTDSLPGVGVTSSHRVALLVVGALLLVVGGIWLGGYLFGNSEQPLDTSDSRVTSTRSWDVESDDLDATDLWDKSDTPTTHATSFQSFTDPTGQQIIDVSRALVSQLEDLSATTQWVEITIRSTPSGAWVVRNAERLGMTPTTFDCPRSSEPFEVTLHLKNHGVYHLRIDPANTTTYNIRLSRLPDNDHVSVPDPDPEPMPDPETNLPEPNPNRTYGIDAW